MNTNEFNKLSNLVSDILERYRKVRQECGISDTAWHSRTIEKKVNPFIKGYFTLAIVGKVSSGKSTFINALLGCKDLLPTGHDQTTCGVTYIEYGTSPEVVIKFGDGHVDTIKGNSISSKIKQHVAIPKEYHHLPVNNIDDMILGDYQFNDIWDAHEKLEKDTLCTPINKDILKKYVNNRHKKDIAVEVLIKYPFNEELRGWKVIDTPGIGAVGGIELKTKQLLNIQKEDGTREVDAIIFLQNGSQTLDQTEDKAFVKKQLESFTEADKRRLFFVLTHSAKPEFINHKDEKLESISMNYGDKIRVLTYADSLLHTFINGFDESEVDLKLYQQFEQPDTWTNDDWDNVMDILSLAQRTLKRNNETINHETLLRLIREWSHFDDLKKEINDFAKSEKATSLREIINLIATDYLGFKEQFDNDKCLVDGELSSINEAIQNVQHKRNQYSQLSREAEKKMRIDEIKKKFDFIDKDIESIVDLPSVFSVRTAITNLFDKVQRTEKAFFQEIQNTYANIIRKFDSTDIIMQSIDFEALTNEATALSQEEYVISPNRVIKHNSKKNEYIAAVYGKKTNDEEKLKNFKVLAIKKARSQRDIFQPQLSQKVENLNKKVVDELDSKLNEETSHLNALKEQLGRKEEFKSENNNKITVSRNASLELIKKAENYGYKY